MFQVGEYVVYKNDVCMIKEIKKNYINNEDYYLMIPINDTTLKIEIPISNQFGLIRKLLSKQEVETILNEMPNVEPIQVNDHILENEYRNLLKSGEHLNLVKIIKTTYLRNKNRLDNHKKIGEKDNMYFNLAEKYLYTEFSVVLNLSYEETKKYIVERLNKLSGLE